MASGLYQYYLPIEGQRLTELSIWERILLYFIPTQRSVEYSDEHLEISIHYKMFKNQKVITDIFETLSFKMSIALN